MSNESVISGSPGRPGHGPTTIIQAPMLVDYVNDLSTNVVDRLVSRAHATPSGTQICQTSALMGSLNNLSLGTNTKKEQVTTRN